MEDLFTEDLYALLDVEENATTEDIKRAWRKKALTCHPDKNRDNPAADSLFLKITKVLDILSDPAQRKKYDEKCKARVMHEKKKRERDATTQSLRDKLTQREHAAKRQKKEEEENRQNLSKEISRLREEGLRIIKEQQQQRKDQNLARIQRLDKQQRTLKICFKSEDVNMYTESELNSVFSKFGVVEHLLVGKTGKTALVLFETIGPALACEKEIQKNPSQYKFSVSLAMKNSDYGKINDEEEEDLYNTTTTPTNTTTTTQSTYISSSRSNDMLKKHLDFEKLIIEKMQSAQKQREKQQKPETQTESESQLKIEPQQ